jgi:hypothetical protein
LIHLTNDYLRKIGMGNLVPAGKKQQPDDGMTKLQRAFLDCALAEFGTSVYSEAIKLRLAGHTFYTADVGIWLEGLTLWEVKGFMRDDAAVKIKVAAKMYPRITFYLVTRPKGHGWQCREVTSRGIGRRVWCPPWLH